METTGQVADLLAEIGLLRGQRDALRARRDDCAALLAEKQAEVERHKARETQLEEMIGHLMYAMTPSTKGAGYVTYYYCSECYQEAPHADEIEHANYCIVGEARAALGEGE